MPPTWSPTSGPAVTRCAWCGAALGPADAALTGRIRCRRCGVATTSPWPTAEQLDTAYGPWYRPAGGRFGGIGDALLRRTRSVLAKRIDRLAPPGPVLDVGSGDGTLIRALHARGRQTLGLERATGKTESAEKTESTDITETHGSGESGTSSRPAVRDADIGEITGDWAAVIFWHSLEHLPDPGAALRHAAGLLVPGGLLVVAIPNSASTQATAFGDRWLALDLPRHLVHVPADALVETVTASGLTPTRISHLRGGQVLFGWAHGLVGTLPGHPDLYDAIRAPEARSAAMTTRQRAATLAAAAVAAPIALAGAGVEVARRRGGSVYLEARAH